MSNYYFVQFILLLNKIIIIFYRINVRQIKLQNTLNFPLYLRVNNNIINHELR